MDYDVKKHGWNRDWQTDNVPDNEQDFHEPPDMSRVHMETCQTCDMPAGECNDQIKCWLIEGAGVYWCGRGVDDFWSDVHEAVKFADQVAAERVLHWMLPEQYHRTCRATEHVFGLGN